MKSKKSDHVKTLLNRIAWNRTTDELTNETISVNELLCIMNSLDHPEVPHLSQYFGFVIDHSVGLRNSQLPFNSHPDLMRRFIRECFGSASNSSIQFTPELRLKLQFQPSLRLLVESAQDLPPMDANNSCDPYFKVFAPNGKCTFISHYIERDRNPVWQTKCVVPLSW